MKRFIEGRDRNQRILLAKSVGGATDIRQEPDNGKNAAHNDSEPANVRF